jgi:hypothetical protein
MCIFYEIGIYFGALHRRCAIKITDKWLLYNKTNTDKYKFILCNVFLFFSFIENGVQGIKM